MGIRGGTEPCVQEPSFDSWNVALQIFALMFKTPIVIDHCDAH